MNPVPSAVVVQRDACTAPLTYCFGKCVDLQTSKQNCGGCGKTCTATQKCDTGACACVGQLTQCGLLCVNLNGNPEHCGACNNACPAGQECQGGTCVTPPPPPPDMGVPDAMAPDAGVTPDL